MSRQSPNHNETNLTILEQVEVDFDVSLETLAEELDLSKSAVHYRLNKLKDDRVIQSITADVDPLALDLEMTAHCPSKIALGGTPGRDGHS